MPDPANFVSMARVQIFRPEPNVQSSAEQRMLRGRKFLISPTLLGPLHTSAHEARNIVHAASLPLSDNQPVPYSKGIAGIRGMSDWNLLRKVSRKSGCVCRLLRYCQRRSPSATWENSSMKLDYPLDIRSKFKFDWRFLTLDVPGKGSILSPEVYERAKASFESMMTEARDLAAIALREEFAEIVSGLVDKLTVTAVNSRLSRVPHLPNVWVRIRFVYKEHLRRQEADGTCKNRQGHDQRCRSKQLKLQWTNEE